ncbi:hypothetical protein ACFL09_00810 [Planctomycetota bacterium]
MRLRPRRRGLRYVVHAYSTDFPRETFRVLKQKELRRLGEYRTRRLVLEAWKRLESGELE